MRRQRLLTPLGIAFALLIVVGGWLLTSYLLDIREVSLLSGTEIVKAPATPVSPDEQIGTPDYKALTTSEIYTILSIWKLEDEEIPHEPKAGQLNMEQAINAGKNGLSYFSENGIAPRECLEYSKTNAYLCEKKPDMSKLTQTSPLVNPGAIRSQKELEPFYSYWTVSFSSDGSSVTIVMNAITGQIWRAEINCSVSNQALSEIEHLDLTEAFRAYLNMSEIEPLTIFTKSSTAEINAAGSKLIREISLSVD